MAALLGVDGWTQMSPLVHNATLPPGLRTRPALGQNRDMSNQCAALAAVMRSTLESWIGGERFSPSSSAVETSKRTGSEVDVTPPRERAVVIMPSEGSRPIA